MLRGVSIKMVGREPTLVVWRVQGLREGLKAAADTGLPRTNPQSVAVRVLGLLAPYLADNEGHNDRA